MKDIYLVPGFGASNLAIATTGQLLWWNPNVAALLGIGALRLAADGIAPGPPDGKLMRVAAQQQNPWPAIFGLLSLQLDQNEWGLILEGYDWRKHIAALGAELADSIRLGSSAAQPATIVAHSMGGLVATVAWTNLVATGQQDLVRRIVTICTPFQGSYWPLLWLVNLTQMAQQLLAMGPIGQWNPVVPQAAWTAEFLNGVALSWPAFYELYPSLVGGEAVNDPNRLLLYTSSNYPPTSTPVQAWLDYARTSWQTYIVNPATIAPNWVLTNVYGNALLTPAALVDPRVPLKLTAVGGSQAGDGVVTATSARRTGALQIGVNGTHSSIPLGIAISGLLAKLIADPRGPPTPPPANFVIQDPIAENVTEPPTADPVTTLTCIGGHC